MTVVFQQIKNGVKLLILVILACLELSYPVLQFVRLVGLILNTLFESIKGIFGLLHFVVGVTYESF